MDAASKRVHIEKAQNFMRQYRDPESRELKKLSANQFMDVWSHYDRDGNLHNFHISIIYMFRSQYHTHTHTPDERTEMPYIPNQIIFGWVCGIDEVNDARGVRKLTNIQYKNV